MKNKLKILKIDEVSVVDRGANQEAFILLHKRDKMEENETIEKSEFSRQLAVAQSLEDLWQLQSALRASIETIVKEDRENAAAEIIVSVDEYANKIKEMLTDALAKKESDMTAALEAKDVEKAEALAEKDNALAEANKRAELYAKLDANDIEYLKSLDKEAYDALVEKEDVAGEIKKALEAEESIEFDGEKICKSKVGEAMFAVIEKMANEKAEAERKYQEEIAKREEQENIQKAESLLKEYPLDSELMLNVYKSFAKMSEEDRNNFEAVFKAGSAALQGLQEQKSVAKALENDVMTDQEKTLMAIKEQKGIK